MCLFGNPVIKAFEREIDDLLSEYRGYSFCGKIKQTLIYELKGAQRNDSDRFSAFASSVDKRQWAMAKTSSVAFDLVASGEYHIMDQLTPEGKQLVAFYKKTLKRAMGCRYIDGATYFQQIGNIDKQVIETGKWS